MHLKIHEVRFWHWNHFWSASILLVIIANSMLNQDFHVQMFLFCKMRQPFLNPGGFFLAFYTLFYDKNDIPPGWFWQRQFFTGFNETISIFGGFIETNRQFHWNHAVFSGFIETISSKKVVSELKFGQKWLKARFHKVFAWNCGTIKNGSTHKKKSKY